MNQQQEWRRAAAQAFIESLEQLQQTMETVDDELPQVQPTNEIPQPASPAIEPVNLDVWAEAIADIDQFIQEKNGLQAAEPSDEV